MRPAVRLRTPNESTDPFHARFGRLRIAVAEGRRLGVSAERYRPERVHQSPETSACRHPVLQRRRIQCAGQSATEAPGESGCQQCPGSPVWDYPPRKGNAETGHQRQPEDTDSPIIEQKLTYKHNTPL